MLHHTRAPLAEKRLPDGRVAQLWPMLFTIRLTVGEPGADGCDDAWCFHTLQRAEQALAEWDGEGEPDGWHRHPATGRRRSPGPSVASPGFSLCRSEGGQVGITCHRCGLTSWNPNDVQHGYCGNCHQFHQLT